VAFKDGDTMTLPGVYRREGWGEWARRLVARGEKPRVVATYCTVTRIGSKAGMREWHGTCGAGVGGPIPSGQSAVRVVTGHWVTMEQR